MAGSLRKRDAEGVETAARRSETLCLADEKFRAEKPAELYLPSNVESLCYRPRKFAPGVGDQPASILFCCYLAHGSN